MENNTQLIYCILYKKIIKYVTKFIHIINSQQIENATNKRITQKDPFKELMILRFVIIDQYQISFCSKKINFTIIIKMLIKSKKKELPLSVKTVQLNFNGIKNQFLDFPKQRYFSQRKNTDRMIAKTCYLNQNYHINEFQD